MDAGDEYAAEMDVVDDEKDGTSTQGIDQEDGSSNAPTSSAREPYQRQTTMEEEDDDDCTDDHLAMEVRKGGAMTKVSKYLVPKRVSNFFRLPERQSYFALATFISKVMADYYVSILIIFLTEILEMELIQAVIIKNTQEGGSRALAIFVAYFTDVYVGHFLMLFLSAFLYSLGLCILRSWLLKFTMKHITWSFYLALVLITIGISGVEFSLSGFEPKEGETSPKKLIEFGLGNHGKCNCCPRFRVHWKWLITMRRQWQISYIIVSTISLFVLPFFYFEWSRIFLILALMIGISLIFLLLALLFYTPKKPNGSLRPYLFIFKATLISKKNFNRNVIVCDGACAVEAQKFHVHSLNDNTLVAYDTKHCTCETSHKLHAHSDKVCSIGNGIKTRDGNHQIRLTKSLRFLEKAASIERRSDLDPTTRKEERSSHQNSSIKKGSIHCTLQQVEETKVLIRILPMSIPFIVFGMVTAAGDTFFLEQASTMHIPKFGPDVLAYLVLVLVSKIGKYGIAAAYDIVAKQLGVAKKKGCDATKLGLAMVLPIMCCATASVVEANRLRIIEENNLLELEDYTVPMNVYWLVPQFFFVGAMEKMASEGIEGFFSYQTAPMMKRYASTVADSMTGVGVLLGIPIFLFIRKEFGWIENNIDTGRLDKFYSLLAVLSAVNFLFYVVIALFCMYWKRKPEKDEQTENQSCEVPQLHPSTASRLSSPTSLSHSPPQRHSPVTAMPPKGTNINESDLGAGVSSSDSSSPSPSPAGTSSSKKWCRDEKEAAKKGSITMQDIELGVVEGTSEDANKVIPPNSLEEESEAQSQEVEEKLKHAQEETSSTSCGNST